jgi:hypothetical protein
LRPDRLHADKSKRERDRSANGKPEMNPAYHNGEDENSRDRCYPWL